MTQCIYCEVITLMNLVDIHSEIRVFFPVVRILKIVQHLSDIPYRVLTVRITMLYILIIHIIKTFHCFKMFPKLCKRITFNWKDLCYRVEIYCCYISNKF